MSKLDPHAEQLAEDAEKNHEWARAQEQFIALGYHHKDKKEYEKAADFFMRSAVAGERCERWRQLGLLWVQCASLLQCRPEGAVSDIYDEREESKHYFPTLDYSAWERCTLGEKIGRAFRNAGYHLEKAGSNQSAYFQYIKAARAFRECEKYDDASRSMYYAIGSYIDRNGEIDRKLLGELEEISGLFCRDNERQSLRRSQLYYRGLAGRLVERGNTADANCLFSKEGEVTRKLARKEGKYGKWLIYTLWKYSSNYGNSFAAWGAWAGALFLMAFPALFGMNGAVEWIEKSRGVHFVDYLYLSVTVATLGSDPSFRMSVLGKIIAIAETGVGLLMLGALVTLLAKKILR